MSTSLTEGSVSKTLLKFSVPFLLAYFLQTLYGLADMLIVGRFTGAGTITAVAAGSQVMHMITVMIVGLTMGMTVVIGRSVGGKNPAKARACIGTGMLFFALLSLGMTAALLFLTNPIVRLLAVPEEAVADTAVYLSICFAGLFFITLYNVFAAVYRGLGDAKSPLAFAAVACLCNIVIDLVLIGGFGMGAAGAALGTVLAQGISVLVSLISFWKNKPAGPLSRQDLTINRRILGDVLKIGVPISLQDGFIQISFIVITMIANTRGVSMAAAVGITEKIITFLFLVPSTATSAISAMAAQNIGAGKDTRAREVLFSAMGFACACGLAFAVAFQFLGERTVALFTTDSAVIALGTGYFRVYVWDTFFAGFHFSFSGYFSACGKAFYSFVYNVLSMILVRVPIAYLTSIWYPQTLWPMGIASPAGSAFASVIALLFYIYLRKKQNPYLTEERTANA